MALKKSELKRYSRQILLSNIEQSGQEKLAKAQVTVIGLGALGSAIASNLVRAGLGRLIIVDRDVVELENLHRQILYTEEMLGEPKAAIAADYLSRVNPDIEIKAHVKDVNFSTIGSLTSKSNVILDGTDNLETRFLINDYSVKNNVPWVYGGIVGTQGMSASITPTKNTSGPCFRCIVPELPNAGALPTCDTFGILNTIPLIIGAVQSTEAIKIILNSPDVNRNLLFYDVWSHEFRSLELAQNKSCKCCVKRDYEFLNVKKRTIVTSLCGRDSVQITPIKANKAGEDLNRLKEKLSKVGTLKKTKYTIEFSAQGHNITIFADGRVLIKGTSDENVAKSLYSKYIGN